MGSKSKKKQGRSKATEPAASPQIKAQNRSKNSSADPATKAQDTGEAARTQPAQKKSSIQTSNGPADGRPSTPSGGSKASKQAAQANTATGTHVQADSSSQPVAPAQPHKAGSHHRQRGSKCRALAWMSVGALVALVAVVLLLPPPQGGKGGEVREVVIPMPGGRNLTLVLPAVDFPDLAAILPNQLGEKRANLSSVLLPRLDLGPFFPSVKDATKEWFTQLPQLPSLEALDITVRDFISQLPGMSQGEASESLLRPGRLLASKGYKAKHPVIIIPGFVTSGLELWEGRPCARRYFRQRMWGTLSMMQTFLRDSACWFSHMELDPVTGLDPPGVKVRAAQGLESVDFFVQGYWVWGKLVEALGDVGYDTNTIATLAYDWRLAIPQMEARDGWFTRAKRTIAMMVEVTGEKAVLASHSYGENVARSFLHWVELGEPGWLGQNVEAHVSLAGVTLGVPKAVTALLSGEMRDTAALGGLASYLTDTFMPRQARARLFRTWGSLLAMSPVGGPKVWGNGTWAPDDLPEMKAVNQTFGALITSAPLKRATKPTSGGSDTADGASATAHSTHGLDNETGHNGTPLARGSQGTVPNAAAEANLDASDAVAGLAAAAKAIIDDAGMAVSDGAQGIGAAFQRMFSPVEESEGASAFLNASMITQMHVRDALDTALAASGPMVTKHYRGGWGAVGGTAGGKDKEGDLMAAVSATVRSMLGGSSTTERSEGQLGAKDCPLPYFPNALVHPLPAVPTLSIYSLYGTGLPTERAYHYVQPDDWDDQPAASPPTHPLRDAASACTAEPDLAQRTCDSADAEGACEKEGGVAAAADRTRTCGARPQGTEGAGAAEAREQDDAQLHGTFGWRMNTLLNSAEHGVDSGIQFDPEGDVTVPIISLGLMPHAGWRSKRLNPGGMRIVAREYKHTPVPLLKDPRGGPATGQHVDILGNEEVLADLLRVVTGNGHEVTDRVFSRIHQIASHIDFEDPDGWE